MYEPAEFRSRAEWIALFASSYADAPPFPKTDAAPVKPADGTDAEIDDSMAQAITALEEAYQKAVETQAKDPDGTTDANDIAVSAKLKAIEPLLAELKSAQAADAASDTTPVVAPDTSTPAKLSIMNTTPDLTSVDEKGNVKPDLVCATDGCGHLSAAHEDLEMSENSGPCTMANCSCEAFTFANASAGNQSTDGDGGAPNNAGGDDAPATDGSMSTVSRGRFAVVPDGSADLGDVPVPPSTDLNPPPFVPGSENMGPAFTIPVGIVEGESTGEIPNREIGTNALTWKTGPWALMAKLTSTHDPSGMDTDDPAILVGRIDSLERADGEGGTQVISAQGFFFADEDGLYIADKLEAMGRLPVSGDVLVSQSVQTIDEANPLDDMGFANVKDTVTAGEVQAFTVLAFGPAFGSCYIVLGDGSDKSDIPQQSDDQMNIAASGQIVHFLSRSACVPCESGMDVLVASGGPLRPPKSWFDDPKFEIDDGRMMPFVGPGKRGVVSGWTVPPTVTEEGEVFGYLAPWGVCHTGRPGCITAPHSPSGYAHFKRGQHVLTAEGEYVPVGTITANTGHADLSLDHLATMAHYDNTALQACDVNMGEDEHGIWYHGALRPEATETQIRMLRASGISGDWRGVGRDSELVAALAVNSPGFPAALMEHGVVKSLVAAGMMDIWRVSHPDYEIIPVDLFQLAQGSLRRLIRRDSLERIGELNSAVAASAREKIASLV